MTRADPQMKLRMPEHLHEAIHSAANRNGRSLNAEILFRLLGSFQMPEGTELRSTSSTLTIRLPSETREMLKRLSERGPYRLSITSIVERGIALAAAEIEAMNAAREGGE